MPLVHSVSVIKSMRCVTNYHTVKTWERSVIEICEAMQGVEYSSCLCTVPPKGQPSKWPGICQGGAKPQGSYLFTGCIRRGTCCPLKLYRPVMINGFKVDRHISGRQNYQVQVQADVWDAGHLLSRQTGP